ncbi:MAG: hypothetical protein HQM12_16010 [SAR324 cluster bacterium]|nr:hypothetical protein [SAR324 cluster bacterium]
MTKKLIISAVVVLVLIAFNSVVTMQSSESSPQTEKRSDQSQTLQSLLEMQWQLSKSQNAIQYYLRSLESQHEDLLQSMREGFTTNYDALLTTAPQISSVLQQQISPSMEPFRKNSEEILKLAYQQYNDLLVLRNDIRQINELLEDKLYPAIAKKNDAEAMNKTDYTLNMSININKFFALTESYMAIQDRMALRNMSKRKDDFHKFLSNYEATRLTEDEEELLGEIKGFFNEASQASEAVVQKTDNIQNLQKELQGHFQQMETNLKQIVDSQTSQSTQNAEKKDSGGLGPVVSAISILLAALVTGFLLKGAPAEVKTIIKEVEIPAPAQESVPQPGTESAEKIKDSSQKAVQQAISEKNLAEAASIARGEFVVQVLTHLRSSLENVQTLARLGVTNIDSASRDTFLRYLEGMDQFAGQILGFSSQVLELSAMESGLLQINPRQENLQDIIQTLLPDLKKLGIHVNLKAPTSTPQARVDRVWLLQALTEVITGTFPYLSEQRQFNIGFTNGSLVAGRRKTDTQTKNTIAITISTEQPVPETQVSRLFDKLNQLKSYPAEEDLIVLSNSLAFISAREIIRAHQGELVGDFSQKNCVWNIILPINA